jgi:hypothetical protein
LFQDAIAVLEPLLSAKENFVRQGAVIALSFILIQQTEAGCPKIADFRKTVTKMIVEKGEDSITKVSLQTNNQLHYFSVWLNLGAGSFGRWWPQRDNCSAQSYRTFGYACRCWNFRLPAALVLALFLALCVTGIPPDLFDWFEQKSPG